MAIIKDQNEQDQEQGQVGSQASSTVSTGGTGSPATNPVAPQAKGSGQFVNLQRYMGANQGNQAVDNSVNTIAKQGTDAQGSYNTARSGFDSLKVNETKDISQGTKDFLNDKSAGYFQNGMWHGGPTPQAGLAQAEREIGGIKYDGPSSQQIDDSYNNLAKAGSGLNDASRTFEASPKGAANRQQLLTNEYTKNSGGNYGSGMGRLDSALVENIGRPTFDGQRAALQQLSGGYNQDAATQRYQSLNNQARIEQDNADTRQSEYGGLFSKLSDRINNQTTANAQFEARMKEQDAAKQARLVAAQADIRARAAVPKPAPVVTQPAATRPNTTNSAAEDARRERYQ